MTGSVIYSKAFIYEAVMRVLYGRAYDERFRSLADLIAEGSSVLDVCCGPGTLFRRYLRVKGVHYTGLDINRHFIERLVAEGATCSLFSPANLRIQVRASNLAASMKQDWMP